MFKRSSHLVAIVATTSALILSGCGRALPGTSALPMRGYNQAGFAAAAHQRAPSLTELMAEAKASMQKKYPHCEIYDVEGTPNGGEMADAKDFKTWYFGAIDSSLDPKNTVYMTYQNGKFSPPAVKKGYKLGYRLSGFEAEVGLRQAIDLLRKSGFQQDFDYADLFQPVNMTYNQAFYVFTSKTAIVTVGATDGVVTQEHSKDWYRTGLSQFDGFGAR